MVSFIKAGDEKVQASDTKRRILKFTVPLDGSWHKIPVPNYVYPSETISLNLEEGFIEFWVSLTKHQVEEGKTDPTYYKVVTTGEEFPRAIDGAPVEHVATLRASENAVIHLVGSVG